MAVVSPAQLVAERALPSRDRRLALVRPHQDLAVTGEDRHAVERIHHTVVRGHKAVLGREDFLLKRGRDRVIGHEGASVGPPCPICVGAIGRPLGYRNYAPARLLAQRASNPID